MPQIYYTARARQDYNEIWRYISPDNLPAADRLLDDIAQKLQIYLEMPEMGTKRDYFSPGLRSFHVKSYLVFYRRIADGIELVRVLHGARNIDQSFFE